MSTGTTIDTPERGWLAIMPRAARTRIRELSSPRSVEAGTEIIREGERTATLGVVVSGRLALQLHLPGAGSVTIATAEPGDVFGVTAIIPPHRATMSVTALGLAELLIVDLDALRREFSTDCELAAAVYYAMGRALLGRLNATHEVLLDLLAETARPTPAL